MQWPTPTRPSSRRRPRSTAPLRRRDRAAIRMSMWTLRVVRCRARRSACDSARRTLRKLEADSGTPLPTQAEGQLNVARAELVAAEAALDKMTVRSPIAATVLQSNARPGSWPPPPRRSRSSCSAIFHRCACVRNWTSATSARSRSVSRRPFAPPRSGDANSPAPSPASLRSSSRAASRAGSATSPTSTWSRSWSTLTEPGPLAVGMKVDVYFRQDAAKKVCACRCPLIPAPAGNPFYDLESSALGGDGGSTGPLNADIGHPDSSRFTATAAFPCAAAGNPTRVGHARRS